MKGTGSWLRKSADKIVKHNFTNLGLSVLKVLHADRENLVFPEVGGRISYVKDWNWWHSQDSKKKTEADLLCLLIGTGAASLTDGTRSAVFKDKTTSSKEEISREVFISNVFQITEEINMLIVWT